MTFVLGHDTHGHAEAGTTGCSGVLHTDAGDVSHGGNVFGVVSATYTDHGVAHDNVQTLSTTSQNQIRQKHQEVEFVVNQSGTNTATNNDGGPTPAEPGRPPRQPRGGRLDPAQRAVQPAEHQLDHVTGSRTRPRAHRGLAAGGDRDPSGHADRADRADEQPRLDRRHRPPGRARRSRSRSPGTHELFLVFRTVTGGQTGGNLFNLDLGRVHRPGRRCAVASQRGIGAPRQRGAPPPPSNRRMQGGRTMTEATR